MPRSLVPAVLADVNSIATKSAWLILFELSLATDPVTNLYLVRNNENITFDGQEYTAIACQLDGSVENMKGVLPSLNLMISNVGRTLQVYLEDLNGAIGSTVIVKAVNSEYLAAGEDYESQTMEYQVVGVSSNAQWVTFSLGTPNPTMHRFPRDAYLANYCNFEFKSVECGYGGAAAACNRTLENCNIHNNSARFGGFKGLGQDSFIIVG